ncbi:hypothetical protein [Fodinibius sediminis]|uniref:Lipoprotein n=1 Tax=Fodinibius sediminis TaxID=1214077 RepID=A0A521F4R1_9BACT|nr:hypothetical protein [Fodinibius sediminis]SMO91162.1 hypothetical protein SAMN06265218_12327 [Fodinibius sediminis]
MTRRLSVYPILALLNIFLIVSCSDDPSSASSEPPALPPGTSMEMDFSSLLSSQNTESATSQDMNFYVQAVYKAGTLEGLIDGTLAKPRKLLAAARDTMGRLNKDQRWEWGYLHALNDVQYQSRLVAEQIAAKTVNWSLYVTVDSLDIRDQLFFDGTTMNDGTEGTWTFNLLSDGEEEAAKLNWELPGESSSDFFLELNILSDGSDSDINYITYAGEGQVRTVEFYNAASETTSTIQWNTENRSGFIIDPDVNDGEKACWDSELQDDLNCSRE